MSYLDKLRRFKLQEGEAPTRQAPPELEADGPLEHRTDKPDGLPQSVSVSGKSVPFPKSTGGNLPMPQHEVAPVQGIQPGDRILWRRGDLSTQIASIDFLHTSSDGAEWLFCTLPNGEQNVLNVKFIFDSQKVG